MRESPPSGSGSGSRSGSSSGSPPPSSSSLAPGFLLAAPRLGDPNFERSVVLLAHHDDDGALGWVLNGRAIVPVSRLLADAQLVPEGVTLPSTVSFTMPARLGGPVLPGSVWMLYHTKRTGRTGEIPEYPGRHDLGGGFAVTGAREAVEAVARGDGPTDFRLLLGYAGWGPQQLEGEIRLGAWLPATYDASLLLHPDADELWDLAYRLAVGAPPGAFGGTTTRGSA